MFALGVVGHLVLNAAFSLFLLGIASQNYPGGLALTHLHNLEKGASGANVYIDNLAAQTGVSRFLEMNPTWRYNKTENLTPGSSDMMSFSHILLEARSKYSATLKPYQASHLVLDSVEGFSHVAFNYNTFPPLRIKTKPFLYILKNKDFKSAAPSPTPQVAPVGTGTKEKLDTTNESSGVSPNKDPPVLPTRQDSDDSRKGGPAKVAKVRKVKNMSQKLTDAFAKQEQKYPAERQAPKKKKAPLRKGVTDRIGKAVVEKSEEQETDEESEQVPVLDEADNAKKPMKVLEEEPVSEEEEAPASPEEKEEAASHVRQRIRALIREAKEEEERIKQKLRPRVKARPTITAPVAPPAPAAPATPAAPAARRSREVEETSCVDCEQETPAEVLPEAPPEDLDTLHQDINVSDQNRDQFDQDIETPDQDIDTPDQDIDTPDQDIDTPDQDIDTPDQDIGTPDQDIGTPDQDIDTPDQDIGTPDQDIGTPDQDIETPDQDIGTPDQDIGGSDVIVGETGLNGNGSDQSQGEAERNESEHLPDINQTIKPDLDINEPAQSISEPDPNRNTGDRAKQTLPNQGKPTEEQKIAPEINTGKETPRQEQAKKMDEVDSEKANASARPLVATPAAGHTVATPADDFDEGLVQLQENLTEGPPVADNLVEREQISNPRFAQTNQTHDGAEKTPVNLVKTQENSTVPVLQEKVIADVKTEGLNISSQMKSIDVKKSNLSFSNDSKADITESPTVM